MAKRFLSNIRINDAYTFPASDGTNNQVIKTDGSGNLSFGQLSADSASVMYKDTFTGDGSTTGFTLSNALNDEVQSNIYIDGVYQSKSTYSVSGTAITFSTAPLSGHEIEVISTTGINSGPTAIYTDTFTANGSATAFTLGQTVHSENQTIVFLNGVYQFKGTYTLSGTTLTLDTAPSNGVSIEVMSIGSAYSGGDILYDHDFTSAGLMTSNGSGVYSITANNSTNWNTAYGWGDHSTQSYATQSYVGTQISNLVDSSPATLDTLNELAAALGDDPNFATTTANSIGTKMPLAGGTFTGDISIPDKLIHSGDTNTYLSFSGADNIKLVAGGKNVLHAHDNGNLYLYGNNGTALTLDGSQNATFAGNVLITGTSDKGLRIKSGASALSYIDFSDADTGTPSGSIAYNNIVDAMTFGTGGSNTERMRIDSSGAVLIGNGVAKIDSATKLQVSASDSGVTTIWSNADDIVFENNNNFGITLATPNTGAATIAFADPEAVNEGYIQYAHGDDYMRFATNQLERMRITSGGNVGIGVTPENWATVGDTKAIQISTGGALWEAYNGVFLSNNIYFDGNNKYIASQAAARFGITSTGEFQFMNAPSGTVDDQVPLVEKLRITSSVEGHVELSGTAPTIKATAGNGVSGLRINIASQSSGQLFRVQENGSTLFQIDNGGKVGIGTTSPLHDLQIGTAATNGSYSMMIEGNFANTALASNPRLNLIDTNFGITAGKYGSGGGDDALGIFAFQGIGRGILFAHTTAGSSTHLKDMRHDMFIDGGTGDVGIGTTSPQKTLDIAASTPTLRLTNTQDPLGNGTVGTIEFFTNDSSTGANRAVSSIVCDNQAGSSVPGGELVFKTSLGGSGSPVATEKMRITDSGRVEVTGNVLSIDTVDEYREDFTTTGSSTPSFDIDLKSIGASGQPFEVFVAWTHYSTSHGAGLHQAYYQRSTIQSDITLIHTYFNQTSSNAGAWSVVWMTGTKIRVQKSSGTHGSNGYGYIRVTRLKP
jgi:hypothetical protein